ncbi:M48 family metalloprotease [Umezawaea sp. Da 62-37]|uniref:M48 family metalloprotease n=1 Tax=Umezawaea sp. Da 62-37 TaxID=3075927 RepID=UPI0028F6E604|nr:M48 family metalloprotease [Umezawaea sp. Da 62-37]WNV86501.1 M48 family metalloprotease [Umezawaea sp. Da 62-37]
MTVGVLRDRHVELLRQHRVADGLPAGCVRPLRAAERYHTWSQVAAEPALTRLNRLSTVRLRPDPYTGADLGASQWVLDAQAPELFGLAEVAGWAVRTPFYAGVFPTGSMNALCRPMPGTGVLVLVDSGVLHLVPDVLKIMIVSRPAFGDAPLLDPDQAASALAEVFNAHLFGNGAAAARPLPDLSGQRLDLLRLMTRRATQFVVAHEMAHVLAGHLIVSWRQTDPNTPVGALDMQAVGWPREYEADRMAARIMLASLDGLSPWERDTVEPYLVGAVLLVLALHEVVAVLADAAGRVLPFTGSHPPPLLRIRAMVDHLAEHLRAPESIAVAADLATWLDERVPAVLEWLTMVDVPPRP